MDCHDDGLPLVLRDNEDRNLGFRWTRSGSVVMPSDAVFHIRLTNSALQGSGVIFESIWTLADGTGSPGYPDLPQVQSIVIDPTTGIIEVPIQVESLYVPTLPAHGRWSLIARDKATGYRREIGWGPCTVIDGLSEMSNDTWTP